MATIFIGGSRSIDSIPAKVAQRIDNIMERLHEVILGDAPGADAAVQRYLNAAQYQQVVVFCSGRRCRNNLGNWPIRHITPPAHARGFQSYAEKDRAMARLADFGLMLWDGQSVGTLANVWRVATAGKATVLFDASSATMCDIRTLEQWDAFAATRKPALLSILHSRLASERG